MSESAICGLKRILTRFLQVVDRIYPASPVKWVGNDQNSSTKRRQPNGFPDRREPWNGPFRLGNDDRGPVPRVRLFAPSLVPFLEFPTSLDLADGPVAVSHSRL